MTRYQTILTADPKTAIQVLGFLRCNGLLADSDTLTVEGDKLVWHGMPEDTVVQFSEMPVSKRVLIIGDHPRMRKLADYLAGEVGEC